jgi:hypothetical protein
MNILKELKVHSIDEEQVLRQQGYRGELKALQSELWDMMTQEIEEARGLFNPRAVYTELVVVETSGDEIRLSSDLVIRAGTALKFWIGLEYLVAAVCTIGPELEDRVNYLFSQDEYPSALMLDSIGSVAADSVADQINYLICDEAARAGLMAGPRLSPGYGTWELREQAKLFSLLPAQSIGIQLTEGYVMIPEKSVSFCVGMGHKLDIRAANYRCRHCGQTYCQHRT